MTADEHLCRPNSDCSPGAWDGNIMDTDESLPSKVKSYSKMGNHHRERGKERRRRGGRRERGREGEKEREGKGGEWDTVG